MDPSANGLMYDQMHCPEHLVEPLAMLLGPPGPHPTMSPHELGQARRANLQRMCDVIWSAAWSAGAITTMHGAPIQVQAADLTRSGWRDLMLKALEEQPLAAAVRPADVLPHLCPGCRKQIEPGQARVIPAGPAQMNWHVHCWHFSPPSARGLGSEPTNGDVGSG